MSLRRKPQHRGRVARVVGNPADPEGLARYRDRYLEWMSVHAYSERTVDMSRVAINFFIDWVEERGVVRPHEVTKLILERYQRHLYYYRQANGRPLSFGSQHSRLSSLRGFFRWLSRQNHILYNPAADLELPRVERRLPRHVLTQSEVEAILQTPKLDDALGLRDRAILEVFYSTGMRRSELIGLSVYDLDSERGTVRIDQGKGNKDRIVPLGGRAARWVDKYLVDLRPSLVMEPDDGTLFLTHFGEPFTPQRMSALVKGHVNAANIGKTGACHLFRHAMATMMLENGADIRFIQQMLGHASVETTQIYTHVSIQKLKEIHNATHPGAKLERTEHSTNAPDNAEPAREALLGTLAEEEAEECEPPSSSGTTPAHPRTPGALSNGAAKKVGSPVRKRA